jgi:hypothetical protein
VVANVKFPTNGSGIRYAGGRFYVNIADPPLIIDSWVINSSHAIRYSRWSCAGELHIRSQIGAIEAVRSVCPHRTLRHNLHHRKRKDHAHAVVKRAAITVTPKQPIDWANGIDEGGVKIGEDFE